MVKRAARAGKWPTFPKFGAVQDRMLGFAEYGLDVAMY